MKSSLVLIVGALSLAPLSAAPQLKAVVIVTRHGVRSPTWEPARLNQYSAQPWPDFGVAPGELTPRGAQLVRFMGDYYRNWLVSEKLLPPEGCSGSTSIDIRADNGHRTLDTARALASSLLPGCEVPVQSLPKTEFDPLFTGLSEPDPAQAAAAIRARLEPNLLADHRAAFDALQSVLGDAPKKLLQPPVAVSVSINGDAAQLNGPFSAGSTLSENLLLEYANGFEGKDLGWGRLNEANLLKVLEIHAVYADLMRRTPYLARTRGASLLFAILQSLREAASPNGKASLLVLSGHDTNLSNLSGMLGLTWKLPGYQPDDTPPGGALVFSLWLDEKGAYTVHTEYMAQTLAQMHNAISGAPKRTVVSLPGCPSADCPWPAFQRITERAMSPARQ